MLTQVLEGGIPLLWQFELLFLPNLLFFLFSFDVANHKEVTFFLQSQLEKAYWSSRNLFQPVFSDLDLVIKLV